ncbi:MAG: WYL domain-containing protein [Coriobacteriales bacterium]|nr:WYL domain-containing protein [Coriobacteriales bacterium]
MDEWGDYREPTEDDRTARRLLSMVIALVNATRPLTTTELRRDLYPELSDAAFQKSFARDRAKLASTGLVMVKAKESKRGEDASWMVDDENSFVEENALSHADALTLDFLLLPMASDPDYPYAHDLQVALAKIDRSFDGSSNISVPPSARTRNNNLARIEDCLSHQHAVRLRYMRADGSVVERTLAPYGFFTLRDTTYLVAARAGDDFIENEAPHTYNLDRVQSVRELARVRYEIPVDFDVRDFKKLPFQLGDIEYSAVFQNVLSGIKRSEPVHDTGIAAAWAIAHGVIPLEPKDLVNACRTRLLNTLNIPLEQVKYAFKSTVIQSHNTYGTHNTTMNRHTQRAGRRDGTRKVRELAALMGSLSYTGASISVESVATRMGITEQEAHDMMELMCQAHGEESSGLLISCNDEETEYTLQYPATKGRPLRLTKQETIAVLHALDLAGLPADDPLRERLSKNLTSADVTVEKVRQLLGNPEKDQVVSLCAQAQAQDRSLVFLYKGLKDAHPRERRVLIKQLRSTDYGWQAVAHDLDCNQERIFRTSRMSDVSLGPQVERPVAPQSNAPQELVCIIFTSKTYYESFEWPGLQVLSQEDGIIRGLIPYYGSGSNWLERRISASGGTVFVDDRDIVVRTHEYCELLLSHLQTAM